MKTYDEDLKKLDLYVHAHPWESLSSTQYSQIKEWNYNARSWRREHFFLDYLLLVLPFIIFTFVLFAFLNFAESHSTPKWLEVILFSIVHAWLFYSLSVYSLHECNAHRSFFRTNIATRISLFICTNFCRLLGSDPSFYKNNHKTHHAYLGTERDLTFTNWIHRRRFLISILPFALIVPYSDFHVHINPKWTWSKLSTTLLTLAFTAFEIFLFKQYWSWPVVLIVFLFLSPWLSSIYDRVRESIEHFLKPADKFVGARDMGLGIFGWIFGGGPWGQAYHLTHHLMPTLPWYQQVYLGRKVKTLLNDNQKDSETLLSDIWKASAL